MSSPGFYVPASVDATIPEQRVLEQSMRLPASGAIDAWAACRWLQANFFDGLEPDGRTRIPVPLALGPRGNVRGDDAVLLSRERLDGEEIAVLRGVRCVREERALFDEMRRVDDVREAAVAMSMIAAAKLTSIRRMRAYCSSHQRWAGIGQVLAGLDLADEGSRSPNETRMRLIWEIDAGFPRPLVNQPVWDLHGHLLGIADLLDPVAGVVGEYDGADHRLALRHSRDIDREGRFRGERLELFRVTGPDMGSRRRVVGRMSATRERALWLPEGERTWTIVPPRGWHSALSLDDELDDRDERWALYAQWEREGLPDLRDVLGG